MPLPVDFIFSQNNLQNFVDCPRRFQLTHLLHTAWPAPVSEPVEEHERFMQLGSQFHRMVHQIQIGIPETLISRNIKDDDLLSWWDSFLTQPPANLPGERRPEIYISMPFAGFRLAAKIDLLAIDPGKQAVIVDWKTTRKPPKPQFIQSRIQSLVYPYLVIKTGTVLNGFKPFDPGHVSMTYWFPAFPQKSITLSFDQPWLEATHNQLTRLIREICSLNLEIFPLTSNIEKCKFCRYRSLCERGITAGNIEDDEDYEESETDLDIDFDDIPGIAF